jgi:HAD superfamily hydrolase (TIGR01548 family)
LGTLAGVEVIDVPRKSDFTVDTPAVIAAIRKHKATLVMLPSPNNPTGTILPNSDAELILQEDCLLVADEAYADFCDVTALDLFRKYDNLIVCRTFSKWAGLAGLRLGYGIAHPDLVTPMMGIKQPYNVNTASEHAGLLALEHRDEIMVSVNALRAEKDRMLARISAELSWLRPVPSDANFVLNEVLGGMVAQSVYQALREAGVIIRFFGKQGGDLSNYIRISAGRPTDTDRVMSTLKTIGYNGYQLSAEATAAAKEAIIFDMDGVLADVTNSQHTAIIETAKLYDVTCDESDIARIKDAGDANNDWKITVNIVNEAGVQPPATLEKVTEQWEELYQGTATTTGLWTVETLLVHKPMLKAICKAVPVAVVTGRPRPDAERFLVQHGIEECFSFMVCHGEAASKPNPEGVKKAMEHLGVKNAVFIGDTPDDIRAAVGAGIVGLGVPAPSSDHVASSEVLRKCGANQVLSIGLHEFGGFLESIGKAL